MYVHSTEYFVRNKDRRRKKTPKTERNDEPILHFSHKTPCGIRSEYHLTRASDVLTTCFTVFYMLQKFLKYG
jgi:hypothetical protein